MISSQRGPIRVLDEVAMGGAVIPTNPVYIRGAERVQWLVSTGGLTNYKLQWARAGGAWISPTDSPLNTQNGTYPDWRLFYATFEGGSPWDWVRLLFFGPAVPGTQTANAWVFDAPIAITGGKYATPGATAVATATTHLDLVEGEDYTIAEDGLSLTPISGGQLTDFATDGGLVIDVFAIGTDEETTADAFVTYGVEPGTPRGPETGEGIAAATGEPPYAIAAPVP